MNNDYFSPITWTAYIHGPPLFATPIKEIEFESYDNIVI